MKTQEWRFMDKSEWADGPWQKEPDKMQWTDEATNLPCLIVRNNGGALCGYVGVTADHPAFETQYSDVDVSCHGGLTFSEFCDPDSKICHDPDKGEPDRVWWLGFDCCHGGDYSPRDFRLSFTRWAKYRDLEYVRNECSKLAAQLAEMKHAS